MIKKVEKSSPALDMKRLDVLPTLPALLKFVGLSSGSKYAKKLGTKLKSRTDTKKDLRPKGRLMSIIGMKPIIWMLLIIPQAELILPVEKLAAVVEDTAAVEAAVAVAPIAAACCSSEVGGAD
jgi:hypothetical protein